MTKSFAIIRSQANESWGANLQALRSHRPGKLSRFGVKRIVGAGSLSITDYIITYQRWYSYAVSIMEFRNGKAVYETQDHREAVHPHQLEEVNSLMRLLGETQRSVFFEPH